MRKNFKKVLTYVNTYVIILLQSRETKTSKVRGKQSRKGKKMNEPMTDYQFKTILKMVLDILESSKDIEEARVKVERLVKDEEK